MAETFYGALGVTEDADERTVERAYRERVKESHPDVSDDPDAPTRFKRLTTARDVLVDETERARYDRLGHTEYVREHLDSSAWSGPTGTARENRARTDPASGEVGTGPQPDEKSARETPADERLRWLGTDWDRADASAGRAAGAGGSTDYGGQGWQRADTFYERTGAGNVETRSDRMGVTTALRRVGPWLAVHAVFVLSALATVWFTYTEASRYVELSVPALVVGLGLFAFVLLVSVVHILSQVHR